MPTYDVIVIGTGGVGSSTLDHLARRGRRVLGLDRFPPGHAQGSSHGRTRIIRQAYFEHPDYVPMLRRAYELWPELEARAGRALFHRVGLLEVGPTSGVLIPGVLAAAEQHRLPLETLTAAEAERRWQGAFRMPEGFTALFEAQAGYLDVEACVVAHLNSALAEGAELRTGEVVESWAPIGDGVEVKTSAGTYSAGRLVISAGAWAADLLTTLNISLHVKRKPLFWLACDEPRYTAQSGFPTFFYEMQDGSSFYGFPVLDELGLKVAEHSGGEIIDDPLTVERNERAEDSQRVTNFCGKYLPGVSSRVTDHAVCLYTMSPDENFIIDVHPEFPQVSFAAGLSGHGFKFTSVLGELMADLADNGRSDLPSGFLSLARAGLRR